MSNENEAIDWSSLVKKEDWLVVWIGFIIMLLVVAGLISSVPSIGTWTSNLGDALSLGDLIDVALLGLGILVLTSFGVYLKGEDLPSYWTGSTLWTRQQPHLNPVHKQS